MLYANMLHSTSHGAHLRSLRFGGRYDCDLRSTETEDDK